MVPALKGLDLCSTVAYLIVDNVLRYHDIYLYVWKLFPPNVFQREKHKIQDVMPHVFGRSTNEDDTLENY